VAIRVQQHTATEAAITLAFPVFGFTAGFIAAPRFAAIWYKLYFYDRSVCGFTYE
jgi:hypothetical protein